MTIIVNREIVNMMKTEKVRLGVEIETKELEPITIRKGE